MDYIIDKEKLKALIEEEVSHAADEAYGEDGTSLYDAVVLTEKDWDTVGRFIDTAVDSIARRTFDICHFLTDTQGQTGLVFYVPDFDETMTDAVKYELNRYICEFVCAAIFQTRRAVLVQQYADMAKAALDKAVDLLKSRKSPIKIW